MRTALNVMALAAFLVLGFGCKKVDGTLTVNNKIKLNKWGKTYKYSPGQYRAQAIFDSKDKVKLEIIRKNFHFDVPEDTQIPRRNGSLFLTSEEVGQPYDLHAEVATDVETTDTVYTTEQCTYTEAYTICDPDYNYGTERCRTEYRTVYGWQEVEYYRKITDSTVTFELLEPGSDVQAAVFSGNDRKSRKIYTYRGMCH